MTRNQFPTDTSLVGQSLLLCWLMRSAMGLLVKMSISGWRLPLRWEGEDVCCSWCSCLQRLCSTGWTWPCRDTHSDSAVAAEARHRGDMQSVFCCIYFCEMLELTFSADLLVSFFLFAQLVSFSLPFIRPAFTVLITYSALCSWSRGLLQCSLKSCFFCAQDRKSVV